MRLEALPGNAMSSTGRLVRPSALTIIVRNRRSPSRNHFCSAEVLPSAK